MTTLLQIKSAGGKTLNDLANDLAAVSSNLKKELGIVTWKTAKQTKRMVSKEIVTDLRVTQKMVMRYLKVKRVAELQSEVTVDEGKEISAKRFKGTKQTGAGVTFTAQNSIGPMTDHIGFMGPRPGKKAPKLHGHAVRRKGDGPTWVGKGQRGKLETIKGPSVGQVATLPMIVKPTSDLISEMLKKNLLERIRYKTLIANGKIAGRTL